MGNSKKKKAAAIDEAALAAAQKRQKMINIVAVLCCVVVLGLLLYIMIFAPMMEKDALIRAGVTYKSGTVTLGTYEQDGDESNGPEDIVWRVMKTGDDEVYLISKNALDVHAYNSAATAGNSWETSDLKTWLQTEFATTAGLTDERHTVTLPTAEEVEKYFDAGADRAVMPTAAVLEKNPTLIEQGAGIWWLRDTGSEKGTAAVVGATGSLSDTGKIVTEGIADTTEGILVRPALIISLK